MTDSKVLRMAREPHGTETMEQMHTLEKQKTLKTMKTLSDLTTGSQPSERGGDPNAEERSGGALSLRQAPQAREPSEHDGGSHGTLAPILSGKSAHPSDG